MIEGAREDRARRAEHGIYGSIVVLAVLVADDAASAGIRVALVTVLGAAVVTSLVHVYADYVGELIRARRHPTRAEWRASLRSAALGFVMAVLPAVALFLALVGAIELETAFEVAEWMGVGLLGTYAAVANRWAGLPLGRSVLIGAAFAGAGAVLVALKVLV